MPIETPSMIFIIKTGIKFVINRSIKFDVQLSAATETVEIVE